MEKEKVLCLDLFRFLCICAVISIHVTSEPLAKLPADSWGYFFYYLVNTGSSFAVPAFLFLSGFVLFYNYEGNWTSARCKSFFYKRLSFTVIPYIIWSFFYFVGVQIIIGTNIFSQMDDSLVKLITGKNYAHLYYIIIILQFYLLFPILMVLMKYFSCFRRNLLIFGAVFQVAFFLVNRIYLHIQATGSFAFTYMLFYLLGGYLALNYSACKNWLMKRPYLWGILWLVSGMIYTAKGWWIVQHPGAGYPWLSYANFLFYYLYVTFSCLALFLISHFLHQRWEKYLSLPAQWGMASFLIYLAHPAVLLLWRHYIVDMVTAYPVGYHLITVLGGIVSLLLPWAGYLMMRKYRFVWLFIGKVTPEVARPKKETSSMDSVSPG
ncbi:acyltransferase [Candidatus Formimonas warabiya]|uniref:Acyltransferase 3 domain-containing protein n=1 Tax=Formimonas warabiya TaxID=1761012 RepID=A0A3G1KV34_FORW1|nr:acyltransferase [Candidatus Formimonas warabiya]ATW26302.1 hypothetical protein DCMF_17420 [Candidatus Formimonas warabiya]